jgi:hypothetical protein
MDDKQILNTLIYENSREYCRLLSSVQHSGGDDRLLVQEQAKADKRKAILDFLRRLRDGRVNGNEG